MCIYICMVCQCAQADQGLWRNNWWFPVSHVHKYTATETKACLVNHKIGFFGDSLLRNIAGQIGHMIKPGLHFKKSWGNQIFENEHLYTYWTPSAYYQQAYSVATLSQFDVVVISNTVWDMGTYYKGLLVWEKALYHNLKKIVKAAPNARILWTGLHKLRAHKCKNSKCEVNTKTRETQFRSTGLSVARSLNIEIYDTFDMTNTSYAHNSDGDSVHYHGKVLAMQAQLLLNMVCAKLQN
jgi:hypothetical protein